jgi:hypothetical protein
MALAISTNIPQTTNITTPTGIPQSGGTYTMYISDYYLFNKFISTPTGVFTVTNLQSEFLTKDKYTVVISANLTGSNRTITLQAYDPSSMNYVTLFSGIQAP